MSREGTIWQDFVTEVLKFVEQQNIQLEYLGIGINMCILNNIWVIHMKIFEDHQ